MKHRRIRNRVAAAIVALGMFASACGSADDANSGDTSGSTQAGTGDTEAPEGTDAPMGTEAPVELSDATLRVGANFASVAIFDPAQEAGIPVSTEWMSLIYGRLIQPLPDREVAPGLLTEWSTPDDQTLELTLREGVTFSDGTPFNGAAIKFSWERCKEKAEFKLDLFEALERVDVVDDTHVSVVLSKPYAGAWIDFLMQGSVYCMSIVSPTAVEELGDGYSAEPVGAGPYMLESYETDQKVVLVRNPDYFNPEQQPYAKIEFTHVALGPSTVTALASDQIDIARVPLPDTVAVEAAGLQVERQPGDLLSHIYLCTTDGPFTNPDARRAARLALDAPSLVDAATHGLGESVTQIMPPGSKYYSEVGLEENQFNLEEAKALAKSSGLEGQTIDLMYYAISPEQATLGEVVKSQMEAIGLTVNLVPSENIYADRSGQKPDMSLWGSFPSTYASVLLADQPANPCNNTSPAIEEALADLWRSDPEVAQAAAEALQVAINEENPILPYSRTVYATGYNDSVGGTIFQPYSHAIGQIDYTMLRPIE